jgi:16S rRNA (guanine966-N2)-methyltransferase
MRIIGGHHKGRRLQSIRGTDVRPTADHVREAMFNILSRDVSGSCVLDLFAGTGALGIEALSRGARNAVFIENASRPFAILRKNLKNFGLLQQCRAIHWDILKNLNCLKPFRNRFDLVFLDPPYHRDLVGVTLTNLLQIHCLASGAIIVAEHELNADVTAPDASLSLKDQRRYGRTVLSFFHFNPNIERIL